jgi:Zn-dependent peptidase ImmA (M78 family)
LSTGSLFIIREIQQKQAWISEVNQDDGEPKAAFIGRFSTNDNPATVANDILRTLEVDPANYTSAPMREWVDKAESNGIFISRTSFIHSHLKLDSEEFQGFAIADSHAPFVFINSDDYDAPQLFTLVHEIAHLWIAATGISNHIEPSLEMFNNLQPIERFCNEVAANALMPDKVLNGLPPSTFSSSEDVYRQGRRLGVSSFALLVRAFKASRISLDQYRQLKNAADREFQAYVKKEEEKKAKQKASESGGGPNYYLLQVNRNSRLFTQTVLDAYRQGYIEPTQASSLLNVKVNKFPKLEEQLYR